jgi:hypothetical protein
VLDAINECADWSGNVPYEHLSWQFCARGRFSADDLNGVLDELEARDFLVRDGPTHHGVHYALTSRGKAQLQGQEFRRAA